MSTAIQLAVDITENATVEAAFSEIQNRLGSIDILVNAAGITGTSRPTHEATEKDFDDVFAVNVKGTFFCSKYAIQSMKRHKTGGRDRQYLLHLRSCGECGHSALPCNESSGHHDGEDRRSHLCVRWNPRQCSGFGNDTNAYVTGCDVDQSRSAAYLQNLIDLHPLKRQAEPEEIAKAVAFLAGPDAGYITAAAIPVDGGYTAV